MTRTPYSSGRLPVDSKVSSSIAARRRNLRSQASRLTLRSTVAAAAFVGLGVFAPSEAWAQCVVGAVTVTCADTSTTDTTFPTNPPVDRNYQGVLPTPIVVTVNSGATISGNGLAFTNNGTGGITVTNNGTIGVDAGNTPTAGGTAALSLTALGGPIVYTGGDIVNNGNGNALDARQNGGIGSVSITAGNIFAATGEGITVRDVATSTGIDITTNGTVTALTAGKDGIDAQSQSLTGNITEIANGNIQAGNAGMVAALLNAGATGNIDVTANGSIDARFGIDAENFGSGNTTVTTVGPVNVTTGNGIFALATGGNVSVTAGDVTAASNTAIIAQQTKVAGAGNVDVTAGNVSGTTGIDAHNFGTGTVSVTANGTVTGTAAEGVKAVGNDAVTVTVADTVTGATRGLSLVGGTGGAGNISVTGTGGFVGGTGDAANILNNGSGNVTVDISGASSSAGGEGIFVRDTAAGGNISVTTGAVTALTAGKDAIDVQAQTLTGNVTEVANGDINAGNAGMVAAILNAAGTGNIDVTANGSMTARFGVDAENFGSGSTSVTTVGPVNVTTGNGIFALATGGNVTVTAGDVTSTGNTAIIAQQTKVAGAGNVDVTGGNVSGTTGIDAHNFGTGTVSVTANGTVIGTFAEGIKAIGNNAVTISVADTVTGATRGLSLVGGTGGAGNISVTGTGGFVGGTGDAANILNNGSGTVTVDISGASSSAGGEGIFVRDTAAGGNISVTTGAVTALTAGKDGIDVQAQTLTGNVTEVANGDINAGNAGMVAAILNAGGTGNIDVTANGSMTARFGVDAENFGSGSTSVTTVGPVNVTTGNGIFALTTGGNVSVTAGDVTATSNTAIIAQQTKVAGAGNVDVTGGNVSGTTGIDAHNFGTGTVSVTANGTVTGTFAEGIKATGNDAVTINVADTVTGATRGLSLIGGTGGAGNISVTGTGGFVGGTGDAANILNNGSGTVTVDISGASSSTGGEGIKVRDTAAGGDISVTTGAVTALTAGMDGIDVQSLSNTANVTIVANGDINAGNAGLVGAIFPAGATGNIDITANGAINARFGVDAENFGTGNTSVTTVGPVTATSGNGIFASTNGGNVTVTAGDVSSTGNTAIIGRQSNAAGAGAIDITGGNVSGTTGIEATNSGTGTVSVTANGTVTGTLNEGIKATGNDVVSVSVADTVTGATNGLTLVGGTGGAGNISVTGTGGFLGGTGDGANIKNNGSGTVTVDISGASGSTSGNGIIVRDTAAGGDISVTTGAVTALAVGKNGIDVQSLSNTANVTEVANGDIQAGNAGMVAAIFPAAATGNIDVTANGAIDARFGVDAENFGTGTTSVTTVGPVNVTTGNGIFALTTGGDVTVNAGDVTSTGNTAIIAQQTKVAGAGNVDVTAGNVSGTAGINAHNFGSGATSVMANGTVNATSGIGIGIAATGNGNVTVIAHDVTAGSNGIQANGGSGSGAVSVTADNVSGSTGIIATNNDSFGSVSVTTHGTVTGTTAEGIFAVGNGDVTVMVDDTVTGATRGMTLIGSGPSISVTGTGGFVGGTGDALNILHNNAGTVTVDISGASSSTGGNGIVVRDTAAGGNISVTTGAVTALAVGKNAIDVQSVSTAGNVTIVANGDIAAGNAGLVGAIFPAAATGNIDITANGAIDARFGVDAENFGTGTTSVTTVGPVNVTTGNGIYALTTGGNASVTAGDVTSTGNTAIIAQQTSAAGAGNVDVTAGNVSGATGIFALNNGTGTVGVTTNGTVTGTTGDGITATGGNAVTISAADTVTGAARGLTLIGGTGGAGNISVNGIGFFGGTGDAANIQNNGAGTVTVDISGASGSTGGNGIVVRDTAIGGDISVTTGAVSALTAGKNAIDALSVSTTANVTVVANGDINAGNAGIVGAIVNGAGTGNVDVTANGAINARFGVDAENFGAGNTTVTTVGPVNVTTGNGIYALTTGGNASVTAGDVTSTGNAAIIAQQISAAGAGNVDVTVGNVSGTTGIIALNNGTGTVGVTTNGTVTGTTGDGITATGGNAVTISAADTVTGAARGLTLVGGTGGAGNISVTGIGFFGGTGDAANIQNNGSGTVTVDISGASASTGGNGIVVRDTAAGGDINVTTGAVSALTAGFNGIDVQSVSNTANVTEIANGDINAGNAAMVAAIFPAAATGNIDVTANGAINARFGVDAENFGTGNTTVTTVGPVNVTTGNGIYALTTGGNVTVNAGDVTSTGNTAIVAQQVLAGGAGNVDVTGGNVSGTTGIFALNNGTGTVGVTTNGTVTGTTGGGITATGNDAVSVTVADTVTGATNGLTLIGGTGGAGNISVTGAGGFFGGTGDGANIKNNGSGTVTVDISGASGSTGGNGIVVRDTAVGGDISVTTGAVTALGAGFNGIDVFGASNTGNVAVVANGDVYGDNAGIVAGLISTSTGNVDVTANGAVGGKFGVDAENYGTGNVTVTTIGPVTATTGYGIVGLTGGGGNVTVNAGDVSSTGAAAILAEQIGPGAAGAVGVTAGNVSGTRGIVAQTNGTGGISVNALGNVIATNGNGIEAVNFNPAANAGTIDILQAAGTKITATNGAGIYTDSGLSTGMTTITVAGEITAGTPGFAGVYGTSTTGGITVNVTGTGKIDPDYGIDLSTVDGPLVVNNAGLISGTISGVRLAATGAGTEQIDNSGTITGGSDGIDATAAGGAILITGDGPVTGTAGNGITAFTNSGAIDILTTGSVTGGVDGISASSNSGNVNIAGTGPVLGTTGFGIYGSSAGGNVNIAPTGPVTSTGGEGIRGAVTGASTVTVTTGGTVTSTGIGIQTQSVDGLATITTNGKVSADSVGIIGNVLGAGSVAINVNADVATTNGNGVYALLQGAGAGTINVNQAAGSLIAATNGSGIRTNSGPSTGATNIVVAGEVTATGAGNAGVRASSTSGDITVQVAATGKIDPDIGVALNTVDGALKVDNAGLITGTVTGVQLVATGGGTGEINNFGTITGGTNAVVGSLNNRPFTLYNAGTLNGAVNVSGSAVAISNFINAPTGIANLTGTSVFAGNLVNGGNVNLGSGSTLTIAGNTNNAARITFAGAGTFATAGSMANTGIINARNNLTSNVVAVGGNYSGGGQFWADYSTTTATADRLNIGGSATGNTNVTMNQVGPRTFVPGGFLPVVTVAGAAPANAFTSSTVFPTTGFILDSFGQNPSNAHQFGLVQAVNPTAAGLGNLSYMAESASGLLDDPISPFVTNRTDAGGTRFSLWMRGSGGHSKQTISSSLTGGGLSYNSTSRFRTDQHAAQIGADVSFGGIGGGWKVNVGVMGGWYGASAPLAGGERIKVETPFIGGYAVVGNGAFELEGNIRKEWRHYTVAMPSLFGTAGTQRMRGDATAGSARISYRIGTKIGFAATPFASFNYADTKIDPLVIDAFSVWTPGSDTTKIGQAGLRLSYRGGSEATATFEPFISAARMENWSRGDSSSFAFGAPVTSFSLHTNTWKNAMRYSAGILANAHGGRVSGFVVGNIDDDSRLRSFTINAGLRFNF